MINVSGRIVLKINDTEVEVSIEEARELHTALGIILGKQDAILPYVPYIPPVTPLPYIPPVPYYPDPYNPFITTTDGHTITIDETSDHIDWAGAWS